MGHFLFGTALEEFSSVGRCACMHRTCCFRCRRAFARSGKQHILRSAIGCLKMAVGEIGVLPDMLDAAPGIANVYFVTFIFIVVRYR